MLPRTQASRTVIYNSKAVGCQFQKDDLGNVRALLRLNPLVVQILTAITLGVFDKRFVDGANNYVFRLWPTFSSPPALDIGYHSSRQAGGSAGPKPCAPICSAPCTHRRAPLHPIVSAATDQARSVNNTVIASTVLRERQAAGGSPPPAEPTSRS